jgi:MSHA biogenesis protein MshO
MNRHLLSGFTMIELIMVIVIVGILATMTTGIITQPVKGYLDSQRRTILVDTAEFALRRMQRDIRRALPNSIRITGGTVLELLHVEDGGRYRAIKDTTVAATAGVCAADPAGDVLDFTTTDTCFEVTGTLSTFNPLAPAGEFLVIYNLGSTSADAYAGNNRTPITTSTNAKTIKFNAFKFPFGSPQQRFFVVDTPVTYQCVNNQLLRYSGYGITPQPNPPAGVAGQIQADKVAACVFTYAPGTSTRAGLITLAITLTDTVGESVQLMQQVHVDNLP